MTFLQPALLLALPLALAPVIIHLIYQSRHRSLDWAASYFLLRARRMVRGINKLRQIFLLALRVLALLALILAATRPLTSQWSFLPGAGSADTLYLILDRSASMETRAPGTEISRRQVAIDQMMTYVKQSSAFSQLYLVDSFTGKPQLVPDVSKLALLPQTEATASSASIPSLLEETLQHIRQIQSGRVDIWIASDLQQSNWAPESPEWNSLRAQLAAEETTRVFLLGYPESEGTNYSISMQEAETYALPSGKKLRLSFQINRSSATAEESEKSIAVELLLNGSTTVHELPLTGDQTEITDWEIPLADELDQSWGRLLLPEDTNLIDNDAFFTFAPSPPRHTLLVSDRNDLIQVAQALTTAPYNPALEYLMSAFSADAISPTEGNFLLWQSPIPESDSLEGRALMDWIASGRSVLFLPPSGNQESAGLSFLGFQWGVEKKFPQTPARIEWWQTQGAVTANTRNGIPLPFQDVEIQRYRQLTVDESSFRTLAESSDDHPLLIEKTSATPGAGRVFALATLPLPAHSTLAREGIAFYALIHRILDESADASSSARSLRIAPSFAEPPGSELLVSSELAEALPSAQKKFYPGVLEKQRDESSVLYSLNRPISEDISNFLTLQKAEQLFDGATIEAISDQVGAKRSDLASEVWRWFLVAMALALIGEAALSIPPRKRPTTAPMSPAQ